MNIDESIKDTWQGIIKMGKLHVVFNNYNMAMNGAFFSPIAIYDGYNNKFIVVSDLYNISFNPSTRKSLVLLFSIFGNINLEPVFIKLYKELRNYTANTYMISDTGRNVPIIYYHSSNIQQYLTKNIIVKGDKND